MSAAWDSLLDQSCLEDKSSCKFGLAARHNLAMLKHKFLKELCLHFQIKIDFVK